MIPLCAILTVATALASLPPLPAGDKTAGANRLAPLERFAGEWVVEGKWSDGQTLHARSVYQWGLNKKILTAKTFVKNGDKEYQRYEAVMAWRPAKKSLFQISFAYDGSLTEVLMEAKDKDTLHIGWRPFAEGKPSPIRQTIQFLDDDRFRWIVSVREGDGWKELINAIWRRNPKNS